MTDITIPPEALEAGRHAVHELRKRYEFPTSLMLARAACLALLKAWPGMEQVPPQYGDRVPPVIILPLTETTNDKA
jgi:hypothetical protein